LDSDSDEGNDQVGDGSDGEDDHLFTVKPQFEGESGEQVILRSLLNLPTFLHVLEGHTVLDTVFFRSVLFCLFVFSHYYGIIKVAKKKLAKTKRTRRVNIYFIFCSRPFEYRAGITGENSNGEFFMIFAILNPAICITLQN